MSKVNLADKKFGRLKVVCDSGERNRHSIVWKCLCECGQIKYVTNNHLVSRNTRSCGCLARENGKRLSRKNIKHGDAPLGNKARLYRIWANMKNRCSNKKHPDYKYYGAKLIDVCNEWKSDFLIFKLWSVANGYKDNFVIDRINSKGNYEPNNCQWLSASDHSRKTNYERWNRK